MCARHNKGRKLLNIDCKCLVMVTSSRISDFLLACVCVGGYICIIFI